MSTKHSASGVSNFTSSYHVGVSDSLGLSTGRLVAHFVGLLDIVTVSQKVRKSL